MSIEMFELGKQCARILSLINLLGTTNRAISAWLSASRSSLAAHGFFERPSVKQRQSYVNIGRESVIEQAVTAKIVRLWISGAGGSGKSSLAFEAGRRCFADGRFVPVVVDFAWRASLHDYVAAALSGPMAKSMVPRTFASRLIEAGYVGLIFDGLSEFQRSNAVDEIVEAVRNRKLTHVLITSRHSCPDPELFTEVHIGYLNEEQLKQLISGLISKEREEEATRALLEFSEGQGLSPLFARLALDYLADHKSLPKDFSELINSYLLSLRAKITSAPSEGDFLRACRLAATACLDDDCAPQDVSEDYLRGVFDAEGVQRPFFSSSGEKFSSFELIRELRDCGILQGRISNATLRLDFVHHPIAEHLATWKTPSVAPATRSVNSDLCSPVKQPPSAEPTSSQRFE
ncbi:hypothetical protein [Bradyrhizobium guangdongense]|uniref:hypothetical protein n=1 Tax=Bradyrhizobium guangdongense TaxID=1325090 RepID=UPI001009AE65|nr:hypothetical protein [Bradyrhizobium guangdongense]